MSNSVQNIFKTSLPKTNYSESTSINDIFKKGLAGVTPRLNREEALKYAMKSGAMDSVRGIKQIYGNLTGNEDLLEELKKKNKKLKDLMEHPEYGDDITAAYFGSAIALDPVGYIPFLGWAKKAKTLSQATKYGAAYGGAYSALGYVDEEEGGSRAFNAVAGTTLGGTLGLGGGLIGRAISKRYNKDPNFGATLKDRQEKFLKEKVQKTKEGDVQTPQELELAVNDIITDLKTKEPKKLTQNVQDFYTQHVGNKVWDVAVKNWGSGLVGTATGLAGVNAFTDEDSTQAQKVFYGLVATLAGVGGTKALGRIPVGDKNLSELMSQGIVDNYALPKRYVQIQQETFGDVNNLSQQAIDVVKKMSTLPMDERTVLYRMIDGNLETAPNLVGFKKESRDLIKTIGQEMVDAGLLSEKIYRKNVETYVHRTYLKYVNGEVDKSSYNAARQFKIIGDELKPRGQKLDKEINIETYKNSLLPTSKSFGRYEGYEVSPVYRTVSKTQFDKKIDKVRTKESLKEKDFRLNKDIQDVTEWEIFEEGAEFYKLKSKKRVELRRDYTKKERQQMGEIEDAAFAVSETARLMTNDLAIFKLYSNIAKDNSLSLSKVDFENKVINNQINKDDWILMPDSAISGAGKVDGEKIKKFGKLSDKYVPVEVYNDLTRLNKIKTEGNSIEKYYLGINRLWKKSKTAWNPTVHVNNTASNVLLYDFADGSYKFIPQGFKELTAGLEGTGKSKVYDLAKSLGVFDVDIISKELTDETKDVLGDTLKHLANDASSEIVNSQKYALDTFKKLREKGYEMTLGKLDNLYQLEDQAFRMSLFMDRLSKGLSPAEAAADAKKWFINYDINAPLINLMRRYPTPFLSYTYRVVPLLAESAIKRPHKFAKWSLGAYTLNEAGKHYGVGDEEKERAVMRDDLKQKMFGMPFLPSTTIKTPFASGKDKDTSLYLDVKRFIPGGDVFSLDSDKGIGIPVPFTDKSLKIPSTLAPSFGALGEVFIPLMTGVDPFTLQKLEGLGLGNDDKVKVQHILSRLTPNVPSTAFTAPIFGPDNRFDKYNPFASSFGSKKISTAFRQATEDSKSRYGTDYTPFEAIVNSFGFKLQPIQIEKLLGIKSVRFRRQYSDAQRQINRLSLRVVENKITKEEAEKQIQEIYNNLKIEQEKTSKVFKKVRDEKVLGGPVVANAKEDPKDRKMLNVQGTYNQVAKDLTDVEKIMDELEEQTTPKTDMDRLGFVKGGSANKYVLSNDEELLNFILATEDIELYEAYKKGQLNKTIKAHEGSERFQKQHGKKDVSTIGGVTGSGITEATVSETVNMVRNSLKGFEDEYIRLVPESVRDSMPLGNQKAMLSLMYNAGTGAVGSSNALKHYNSGDLEGFYREGFDRDLGFTKITGADKIQRVDEGLVNRRSKELELASGKWQDPYPN